MNELEALLQGAEWDWQAQRYKAAHIKFGQAMGFVGRHHAHCRYRRGVCSLKVALQRIIEAERDLENHESHLHRAAGWLTKAEAYLASATEDAGAEVLGRINLYQSELRQAVTNWKKIYAHSSDRPIELRSE